MSTASSEQIASNSSDPFEAARKILAEWDAEATPDDIGLHNAGGFALHNNERIRHALRALIEPPAVDKPESPGALAVTIQHRWSLMRPASMPGGQLTTMLTEAVQAGIQAAWKTWGPRTATGNKLTESAAATLATISAALPVNNGDVYVNPHGAALLVFDEEQIHINSDGTAATEDTINYRSGWEG